MEWFPKYIAKYKRALIECYLLLESRWNQKIIYFSAQLCRKKQNEGKPETIETGYLEMVGSSGVKKLQLVDIG